MKELHLFFIRNTPIYVGTLKKFRGDESIFQYGDYWLTKGGFPLSGDMPLISDPIMYKRNEGLGAINDSLPDRWGDEMLKILHKQPHMSLLERLYYAGDNRFGALGYSSSKDKYLPCKTEPLASFNDVNQLYLDINNQHGDISEYIRRLMSSTKSMGGAHPKALMIHNGIEYIVKFGGGSNIDVPLIEHAAMTLASKCGIKTANTFVIPLDVGNVLAVERFDRDNGNRLHALSFNTVASSGFSSRIRKPLSYTGLSEIARMCNDISGKEVFKRMLFNILIDNTDDHEKNHAFIYTEKGWGLSPAYDVLPSASGTGTQQLIVGRDGYDSTIDNAISGCNSFGLKYNDAVIIKDEILNIVSGWKEHFKQHGVLNSDIDYLSTFIDPILNQETLTLS